MKKLLLLSLMSIPSWAALGIIQGNCEEGGIQAVTAGVQSTSYIQASYPGCTFTVYIHGTLTLATIYQDTNSSFTQINPGTAAGDGYYFFYAPSGDYDIKLSGGSILVPFVRRGNTSGGGGGGGLVSVTLGGTTGQIGLSGTCSSSISIACVMSLVNTGVTAGSYTNANITVLPDGRISTAANGSAGTGGTPGGSTTQLQYNNGGVFGGISGATSNGATITLTSPTLIGPALGTPVSGIGTFLTGIPLASAVIGLLSHGNIAATAITPGTYVNPTLTLQADGTVTAASNGVIAGLFWTVGGQNSNTISIPSSGPFTCNGVVTPILSGTTTITLVTGSAADNLLLAISCNPITLAHLRVYTASRTVNVTCVGFVACDTVTSAAFQFGDYPLASVAIPASTVTFGSFGPTLLSSQGSFNPTPGNCQSIVPSGSTITFSVQPVCTTPSVTIATVSPATDPGTTAAYLYNNSSGAMTFPLPAGAGNQQRCYRNATGRTGVITIAVTTSNAIDLAGVNGTTSTGTLVSGGALGDQVCLVSDSTNHWYATTYRGTWTNN